MRKLLLLVVVLMLLALRCPPLSRLLVPSSEQSDKKCLEMNRRILIIHSVFLQQQLDGGPVRRSQHIFNLCIILLGKCITNGPIQNKATQLNGCSTRAPPLIALKDTTRHLRVEQLLEEDMIVLTSVSHSTLLVRNFE